MAGMKVKIGDQVRTDVQDIRSYDSALGYDTATADAFFYVDAPFSINSASETVDEVEGPDACGNMAEQDAIARELQDRIEEAMERLTNRQRTALHLRAAEGMDYAAISTVLGCSSPAARMHVLEARRKILDRVKEHLDP